MVERQQTEINNKEEEIKKTMTKEELDEYYWLLGERGIGKEQQIKTILDEEDFLDKDDGDDIFTYDDEIE